MSCCSRGQFSVVVKGIEKSTDRVIIAKLLELRPDTEKQVTREFETLRSLRHERIGCLLAAFKPTGSTTAVLILEKLQGANVLTYLSSRHEYTEQIVATIVSQVRQTSIQHQSKLTTTVNCFHFYRYHQYKLHCLFVNLTSFFFLDLGCPAVHALAWLLPSKSAARQRGHGVSTKCANQAGGLWVCTESQQVGDYCREGWGP